jgi:hypothetical protein
VVLIWIHLVVVNSGLSNVYLVVVDLLQYVLLEVGALILFDILFNEVLFQLPCLLVVVFVLNSQNVGIAILVQTIEDLDVLTLLFQGLFDALVVHHLVGYCVKYYFVQVFGCL